jgi:hypothetical protein
VSSSVWNFALHESPASWDIEVLDEHDVIALFVVDKLVDELAGKQNAIAAGT